MAINLAKTESKGINLTKTHPALTQVKAILWWTAPKTPVKYDLDVSAFILKSTPNGPKLLSDDHFIFYNQENSTPEHSVWKTPDQRGGGSEELFIDILALLPEADEVSIVVTIHDAIKLNQHFGEVPEAGIKLLNAETNEEIAFYDLDADFKNKTAVQIGSFFKQNGEFTFQAVGEGFEELELGDFVAGYQ
jgi:tellurium resistance protein TerD